MFYRLGIMQFVLNFLMAVKSIMNWANEFVFKLIEILQPLFKKDVYFFRDTDNPDTELIDAYSLFCYMEEKGYDCYYIMSKFHPQYAAIKEKHPKNIIALNNNIKIENIHRKYFFKFLRLKMFFSSWGSEFHSPAFHKFLYNNRFIDYIFLQHGIILLKSFLFDLYDKNWFNKMLVSNDIEKEIVIKNMKYNENQLIKAALPRLDLLGEKTENKKSIFMFFTWRLSFDRIDYTFSKYYSRICALLENKKLHELLEKNNITLNVSLHHKLLEKNSEFEFSKNIKLINPTQVSKYIKKSDMLVTDYSSIWADFLVQDKPVVFYRLDYDDENLIAQDRGDLEFAKQSDQLMFNVSYDEEKTVKLIEKYIKNGFELESENKKKSAKFYYCKKNIRAKILEELGI